MKKLTTQERAALYYPWMIESEDERAMANKLVRRGLLSTACGDYFITEAGRAALAASGEE